MTEKTKTTWKAIGAVVTIIIAAIGTYAALVSAGVLDNPRAKKANAPPVVGDTYHFGSRQWRVLDIDTVNNRALLLSEDIIEQKAYNDEYAEVTWETCTLRAYLNSIFYESFNEGNRSRIVLTRNTNPDNTWARAGNKKHFGAPGGSPTDDYIFLLSVPEVLKYFPGLKLLKESDGAEMSYQEDERLAAEFNKDVSSWWLRSPGISSDYAADVFGWSGEVSLLGNAVAFEGGIRPALWIKL